MADRDIEKSFMYWAGLASRLFSASFNNELSGTGLTYRQAQVLVCLATRGELAQNELASLLQIEPPTVVRILDRMERDGFIERLASPDDRRKKIIRPTDKAASKQQLFEEIGMRIEKRASESLDPSQLDTLREVLEVICRNLGSEK